MTAETAGGRRFASFGPGSLIAFPTGSVYGERWITIGAGTMVGEQASICAGLSPGHDLGPGTVLRIGDRCVIGRGSHIVAHHSIDIGDDVFTGPYVYITDQNHSYADPDVPIGRQWPVNAPVSIGAGTWLGTGVIVLPGAMIGRNVVVAAGAVVRGEIGDLCVVAGAPARVVKVFDPEVGWTRPLPGSEEHIEALVNEALATDVLATDPLVIEVPGLLAEHGLLTRPDFRGSLAVPLADEDRDERAPPLICWTNCSPCSARSMRSAALAALASRLPSLRYIVSMASTAPGGRCGPSSERAVR